MESGVLMAILVLYHKTCYIPNRYSTLRDKAFRLRSERFLDFEVSCIVENIYNKKSIE